MSLPCLNSGNCRYHKHSSRPNHRPHTSDSVRTKPSLSLPLTALFFRRRSQHFNNLKPLRSPLELLPTELLNQICSYLSLAEVACLALSSRTLATIIGSQAWEAASHAHSGSWYQHAEMLDLLQHEYDTKDWWCCKQCSKYHRRTRRKPPIKKLISFLGPRKRDLKLGPPRNPVYVLQEGIVKDVLGKHTQNPTQPVCLESLRCTGALTTLFDSYTAVTLTYTYTPRIVIDKVLLHSSYIISPLPFNFIVDDPLSWHRDIIAFLSRLDFRICNHLDMGHARRCENLYGLSGMKYRECERCGMEWGIEVGFVKGTQGQALEMRVMAFQNLGKRVGGGKRRWWSSGRKRDKRMGDEEGVGMREVFERIWCSTMEEYVRQVETARNERDMVYIEQSGVYPNLVVWKRWRSPGKWNGTEPLRVSTFKSLPWRIRAGW